MSYFCYVNDFIDSYSEAPGPCDGLILYFAFSVVTRGRPVMSDAYQDPALIPWMAASSFFFRPSCGGGIGLGVGGVSGVFSSVGASGGRVKVDLLGPRWRFLGGSLGVESRTRFMTREVVGDATCVTQADDD